MILIYYFDSHRGVLSVFESTTGVIISFICRLTSDVTLMSLRLHLGSVSMDSIYLLSPRTSPGLLYARPVIVIIASPTPPHSDV